MSQRDVTPQTEREVGIERIAAVLRDRGMFAEKTAFDDHIPDDEWERAGSLANAVGLYDAGLRLIEGSDPASPEREEDKPNDANRC